MNVLNYLFVLCAVLVKFCSCELPSDIQKCKSGDTDCILDRMNYVLRHHPEGYPDIGLQNLKEITLKDIVVSKAEPSSPVQLNFFLKTATFYGIENTTMTKAVGFEADPTKSKFETYGTIPRLICRGKYEASGKVLLLPINGHGDGEFIMKNFRYGFKAKTKTYKKDNQTYVEVVGGKAKIEVDLLEMKMDNILDGNKEVSQTLNTVLNENWKDIWNEIESGLNKAVVDVCVKLIAGVLKHVPYDNIYLD